MLHTKYDGLTADSLVLLSDPLAQFINASPEVKSCTLDLTIDNAAFTGLTSNSLQIYRATDFNA